MLNSEIKFIRYNCKFIAMSGNIFKIKLKFHEIYIFWKKIISL